MYWSNSQLWIFKKSSWCTSHEKHDRIDCNCDANKSNTMSLTVVAWYKTQCTLLYYSKPIIPQLCDHWTNIESINKWHEWYVRLYVIASLPHYFKQFFCLSYSIVYTRYSLLCSCLIFFSLLRLHALYILSPKPNKIYDSKYVENVPF